jgi:hypothetical protein
MTNDRDSQVSVKVIRPTENIEQAQEKIYSFLMSVIKTWSPEAVLQEFNSLFIQHLGSISSGAVEGLYEIVVAGEEDIFHATLKRCCYILINNWKTTKQVKHIHDLVELFNNPSLEKTSLSPISNCLRHWLKRFIISQDYQEIKLFADKIVTQQNQQSQKTRHWSERYSSHMFVAQSVNPKNSLEHREAAKERAKHLRYRFKFDLTMYLARTENDAQSTLAKNPTGLGDDVLRLVKTIVAKREPATYKKFAKIFTEQSKGQKYKHFKQNLHKYLSIFIDHEELLDTLELKTLDLYEKHNEEVLSDSLLIITCNRLIENLTTENHRQPSSLFLLLISQNNTLTLVTVLLKIILICKPAHAHLETCLADLIRYYENFKEEECDSMINFLEMYNIMLAIYGDSTTLL